MRKLSSIGSLLKKIYRLYTGELINLLQKKGFTDLRPSFLEVLLVICENDGRPIKVIGQNCGLKKQTMTGHINELERRGYIIRKSNEIDKREQNIFLTEYGQKFKLNLLESVGELEKVYLNVVGDVELDRLEYVLKNFFQKISMQPQLPELEE